MKIHGSELHFEETGLVVETAPVIWRTPALHEPPVRTDLLIVYREYVSGELFHEYLEWTGSRWRFVGDTGFLPVDDVVLLWTYPPAIPAIDEIWRLAA